MPANFPTSIPSIVRVLPGDFMDAPGKEGDVLHNAMAEEVEAIATVVGVTGSVVPGTVEARLAAMSNGLSVNGYITGVLQNKLDLLDSNPDVDFRTVVGYSQLADVVVSASVVGIAKDLPFFGWGDLFQKALSGPFNSVRLMALARTSVRKHARWKTISVFVRTGVTPQTSGTVVAVGSVSVPMQSDTLSNILILLRDPSTSQPKTLQISDLTDTFFIGYYALSYDGYAAACGECSGVMQNHAGSKNFYVLNSVADPKIVAWTMATGSTRSAIEQLLLTDGIENFEALSIGKRANKTLAALGSLGPMLPPYVYGMEGRECNVYFNSLFGNDAWQRGLHVDVTTSPAVGKQQAERFTWTPSAGGANSILTLAMYDDYDGSLQSTQSTILRYVAASAGAGANKKLLFVGDSLGDDITTELLNLASVDVMALTLIGTQGSGLNKHESRSGWTIQNFYFSEPPFRVAGLLNFPQYLANNALAVPDWVVIQLGTNDMFGKLSDSEVMLDTATRVFTWLSLLIANIKSAGAGVKVAIVLPPPPSRSQDAFGENYGCTETTWRFRRNMYLLCHELIAHFSAQEGSRTYLIPGYCAIDTVNNMAFGVSGPVNSRSSINTQRQSNGVHPDVPGYKQIADQIWAFLKYHHAA